MRVTVEGVITSIEQKSKTNEETKKVNQFTEVLLAQKGEKTLITIRIPGHVEHMYTQFEVADFSGRLMTWKTRDGIGSMVMIEDDAA